MGIHITLNAEWELYRWNGVLPSTEIPSLLDNQGYLYATVEEVAQHARAEEVEQDPGDVSWEEAYRAMIEQMQPGLNLMIVHLAFDNDEMRAISVHHPDFGAAWRQRDLDFVTGDAFREMLEQKGIRLITWKQIQETMVP